MSEEITPTFITGLQQLGLEPSSQLLQAFLRYQQELLEWNTRFNLTAIKDPAEIFLKHFLDSLSLLTIRDAPAAHLFDIGSGAGFPGLPLAIVRPDWHITLLEATGKKVRFLQHIGENLQLRNVTVIHGRAEELAHRENYRAQFNMVTARAVSALPVLLEYAAPYCRQGGILIFPKKGDLTDEMARAHQAAPQVGAHFRTEMAVTLPGLDDGRSLLVWEQRNLCPSRYPRHGATITRQPLA